MYAPKKPVPTKTRMVSEIQSLPKRRPIKNEPVMFTRKVPKGNNLKLKKYWFKKYLEIAPRNPPKPTSQIWLTIFYAPRFLLVERENPVYAKKYPPIEETNI